MLRVNFENVTKYYTLVNTGGIKNFLFRLPSEIKKIKNSKYLVLENISFKIFTNDIVGVIGKNGAGKSTLLGLIAGVLKPTKGKIYINGRVAPLLELGAGFHPDLTGYENIILNGILLGMTRKEIKKKLDSIIEFSELGDFIFQPVRLYSSGMLSRLGFSVAIHTDPDILLVDEVLSVGDQNFQKKCLNKMFEFKEKGKTIIFVSHNMKLIKDFCTRVMIIHQHKLIFDGEVERGIEIYEKL